MKKKSILYLITQGEFGGAQHYILDLAKNMQEEYEVKVVFGEEEKSQIFIKLLEENFIPYQILPELKREIDLKVDYRVYKTLRDFINREKPDIIHLNSSKISILGSLASRKSKAKVVYTAHGWVFNEKLPAKTKMFYTLAEKFTQYFKDRIICVSEHDRLAALEKNIAPKSKLSTIHNGIADFQLLTREQAREEIVSLSGSSDFFSENEFVIGSIGYLYKNKGYDYLLNAIKVLNQNNIGAKLVIAGSGPEEEELKNWITQLQLEKSVLMLGEVRQASRLLRAFDIYVCSSLKEGLSYTLIEAMTATLPIIATQVGGNTELISEGKEGLLVEPANAEAIAKAILEMSKNPEKAQQYAQKAHQKAVNEFSIENMIQRTKYLYDSL